MTTLAKTSFDKLRQRHKGLESAFNDWRTAWEDIAKFYIPRRYSGLENSGERAPKQSHRYIVDSTGTLALRTLGAGFMGLIVSPARPWLRLGIVGRPSETLDRAAKVWIEEVEARMLRSMAQTNFYQALGTLFIDYPGFGVAAMLIYEDFDQVFRCYNSPVGEFMLGQDGAQRVSTFARTFKMKAAQMEDRWGREVLSRAVKNALDNGGHNNEFTVNHIILPNDGLLPVPAHFETAEAYWEPIGNGQTLLGSAGFNELPGVFPRWEVLGNDIYGTSPAMESLPDVRQLQQETLAKARALDKMIDPPMLVDAALQHRKTGLYARGITYVPNLNTTAGARPVSDLRPPIAEISSDIANIQNRVREGLFNDLFFGITQLQTVRSATEIDARREEKLVKLGSVLDRFKNEALDPAVRRIYAILERAGLIPPPPPSIAGAPLSINYESVLVDAQRAVGTIATERFFGLVGNLAGVYPEVRFIPDVDELLRDYADKIGVPAKGIRDRDEAEALTQQEQQAQRAQQQAALGAQISQSAQQLSQTDVGGGVSALESIIGGG